MIGGIFFEGSGLGDQLFRYITVRTLAEEKGFDYGMVGDFKGDFFLHQPKKTKLTKTPDPESKSLWFGEFEIPVKSMYNEKDLRDAQGNDIRSYDPEINFVEDNTIIDGSFEDSKYWHHNLENINKWLAVEPLSVPDDKVILGFRGGEYASNPDLFLTKDYWLDAMNHFIVMKDLAKFEVHTDDPTLAKKYLPYQDSLTVIDNQPISHSKHTSMGFNWRSARYAKYAIIPNSAFFILPRLLKHLEDPTAVTIAPRYWARHNTKVWARPACYYKEFTYI